MSNAVAVEERQCFPDRSLRFDTDGGRCENIGDVNGRTGHGHTSLRVRTIPARAAPKIRRHRRQASVEFGFLRTTPALLFRVALPARSAQFVRSCSRDLLIDAGFTGPNELDRWHASCTVPWQRGEKCL